MKTILVCGATGFIGKNLVYHYNQNKDYKVKAVYNKRPPYQVENVSWVKCDLRDPNDIKKALEGVDIIMHFAATTTGAKDIVSKPYIHVTDNVIMTSYLLREAFEQGIEHFIFPSCTIMYQKSEEALKETDFNPSDDLLPFYYGAGHTKIYLENMCKFYSGFNKTKHTVIRHSNMYGPHDKYDLEKSHVTGATITKVMTSENGKVNVWGTGEEARDLLYIEDLIDFIDLAINKIIDCSGKDLEMVHDLSKPTIPTSLFLDCTRANKILGWSPKHTLEEGIKKTLNWYRNNLI